MSSHTAEEDPQRPEEATVVVSGFSPWGPGTPWPPLPINTSWLLANAMPRVIFRRGKPNIRIISYPDPVRTAWGPVRKLVPKLWDGDKEVFRLYIDPEKPNSKIFKVDAMLHIGMLDKPGEAYRLERNAFKHEYKLPDVDGRCPDEDDKTGGGTWKNVPEKLSTDLDLDSICQWVSSELRNVDIITSEDPERFLCGYIYFTSLAELYNRNETKRVIFLHIPIEYESEDIERGVTVASRVIEAMVDDLMSKKSTEVSEPDGSEAVQLKSS